MSNPNLDPDNDKNQVNQFVGYSKGNVNQTGRDNINNTNINLLIPLFLVGIVALGGIAWAFSVGLKQTNQQTPQVEQPQSQPSPSPESTP